MKKSWDLMPTSSQATRPNKSGTIAEISRRLAAIVLFLPSPGEKTFWKTERWLSLLYSQSSSEKLGSEARSLVSAPKPQKKGDSSSYWKARESRTTVGGSPTIQSPHLPSEFLGKGIRLLLRQELKTPTSPFREQPGESGRKGNYTPLEGCPSLPVDALHRAGDFNYSLPDENSLPSQTLSCQLSPALKAEYVLWTNLPAFEFRIVEEITASSLGSEAYPGTPSQKTWLGSEVKTWLRRRKQKQS